MGTIREVQIHNWINAGKPLAKTDGDGLTFTLSAGRTASWVLRPDGSQETLAPSDVLRYCSARSRLPDGRIGRNAPLRPAPGTA
jgi:hypothetical protein